MTRLWSLGTKLLCFIACLAFIHVATVTGTVWGQADNGEAPRAIDSTNRALSLRLEEPRPQADSRMRSEVSFASSASDYRFDLTTSQDPQMADESPAAEGPSMEEIAEMINKPLGNLWMLFTQTLGSDSWELGRTLCVQSQELARLLSR